MKRAARWIEIGVGAFFLVAAAAKALDMDAFGVQISAYNVVKDAELVRVSAYFALALEALLGAALVGGLRFAGATHLVSAGMIVVYSSLIVYAWRFHGLEDCGCLGQWIEMGPVESLIKNAVLVALLGSSWFARGAPAVAPGDGRRQLARSIAAGSLGAVLALAAYDLVVTPPAAPATGPSALDPARPFAQFVFDADGERFDLGEGAYLVALLNATCDHCRASVPALNELFAADGMPEMVALMMGSERELEDFRATTSPLFVTHRVPPLKLMEFIGTAPPRLVYVVDGKPVRHWDWQDETPVAEVLAFVSNGGD